MVKKEKEGFPNSVCSLGKNRKPKQPMDFWKNNSKKLSIRSKKEKGDTKELIVSLLETRLDNLVYRLGFAKTRYMARQIVSHGHVSVNGKKLNIPSYQVNVDDVISISDKMQKNPVVLEIAKEEQVILPFLKRQGFIGKLERMPKMEDVQVPFDLQLIIEYYSR